MGLTSTAATAAGSGETMRGKSMRDVTIRFAAVAALCVALPGCGGFAKALGLEKNVPDEFAIVTKAPLVIPPDFTLRPPRPGASRPQEIQPSQVAAEALFNQVASADGLTANGPSRGESALLARAGALQADSSIREVLEAETTLLARRDPTFADQILFWQNADAGSAPAGGEEQARIENGLGLSEDATAERGEAEAALLDYRQGWF